jgi:hypothetical protein
MSPLTLVSFSRDPLGDVGWAILEVNYATFAPLSDGRPYIARVLRTFRFLQIHDCGGFTIERNHPEYLEFDKGFEHRFVIQPKLYGNLVQCRHCPSRKRPLNTSLANRVRLDWPDLEGKRLDRRFTVEV